MRRDQQRRPRLAQSAVHYCRNVPYTVDRDLEAVFSEEFDQVSCQGAFMPRDGVYRRQLAK